MKSLGFTVSIILTVHSLCMGSHIVGGEISLEYLRGNSYNLGLVLYYDQANANRPLIDDEITLGIFRKRDDRLVKAIDIPLGEIRPVNYSNSACVPDSLKTLQIDYSIQANLFVTEFSDSEGYYITWERCCRNSVVSNMLNPGSTGMVFYLEFPSLQDYPFNSSPKFDNVKGDYICRNQGHELLFSATDADGDLLVYDLVVPLAGHTQNTNPYSNLTPGPYPIVQGFFPMPSNPQMAIDPTGLITVRPLAPGLFGFTVRCQEFRDGNKIGEVRRDFQIPVTNCPSNPAPSFQLFANGFEMMEGDTLIAQGRDSLCFQLKAWDTSDQDRLAFSIEPKNFEPFEEESFDPAAGFTFGPEDTVRSEFCWPRCFISETDYVFEFDIVVTDFACPIPNKTIKSFKLISFPEENQMPSIETEFEEYEGRVGEELRIRVSATDPNIDDILTLEFIQSLSPEFDIPNEFNYESGDGWADGELIIYPDCQHLDPDEFDLHFSVFDNSCRENSSDTTSTTLIVADYKAGESDFTPPPNVVTANGDGYNDVFSLPETLPGKCEKGAFENVYIYNRWGQLVFESKNKKFEWSPLSETAGNYFYLIQFEEFSYTGYIMVIR